MYNGMLLRHKKEWSSDTCYDMDEPRKHYAKWNKPDIKGQILCESTYEISKIGIFIKTENSLKITRGWGRGEGEVIA